MDSVVLDDPDGKYDIWIYSVLNSKKWKDSGILPKYDWKWNLNVWNKLPYLINWIEGNGCWNDDFFIVQSLNMQFTQGNLLCSVTILDLIL
jgi:hypothetical protein